MRHRASRSYAALAAVCVGSWTAACSAEPKLRFEISFSPDLRSESVTGRAYVIISADSNSNALQQRSLGHQPVSSDRGVPFFAADVHGMAAGEVVLIDGDTPGFPQRSLSEVPPGEYYVQALLNVYTEFQRSDGHTIWAHMDQWDGQHFNWAPGNLVSPLQRVRLDPRAGYSVELELTQVFPPIELPPDDEWVKRIRIQSDLLTEFWGRPIHIGATVLLPRDYEAHPEAYFPTVYQQGHFDLRAPFVFQSNPSDEPERESGTRYESGRALSRAWQSDGFPRMFAVTLQHPTPYFDDSYAVNSVNNGPYADAILTELIPALEERFRMIPEGYARVLTGGSTGGYEALALQVHHPSFFGGAWVFAPDPIDFRSLFTINIYEDDNAFEVPGWGLGNAQPERYAFRSSDGQPIFKVRELSRLAAALGSRGRSTDYLDAWDASFGPVGDDGYPRPLWDRQTGEIDTEVASYWRDRGYDLRHYTEENWPAIGPDLVGKLHFIVGDMDDYYFNLPVYRMEEFLESTTSPYYGGSFRYGRPMKSHGWSPLTTTELLREMAERIASNAPAGANVPEWNY